eukprot:gene1174-1742_t
MQGLPQPLIEFSDAMDGDSEDPINAGSPEGVDDESSSDSWDTTDAGETFDEPPAAAATLGEQEEPCLRPWERLSSTILPPSESFSYPDPNVLTVAGCGSHALHRRVLDLAWQQKETAKETQLGHMPTQLYDSVASLMASLPSYT